MRPIPLLFQRLPRRAAKHGWGFVPPAAVLVALLVALTPGGCAKTEDVTRLDSSNRVQDQRLRALEEGVGTALRKISADLQDLRRVLDGRTANLDEQLKQFAGEQAKLLEAGEVTQAQQKRIERRLEEQTKAVAQYRAEADSEMDKLRLRMKDIEGLMRSPISQLPATTESDKAYREATFLLINGQMDLAADRFGQFAKRFTKDPRRPEALMRQGQAYFLIRQYDHALVPLFEVVEKNGQHKAAGQARWLLARSLEETGDLKLARDFYAQLVNSKSEYSADASRRAALMNRLLPGGADLPVPPPSTESKAAPPEPAQEAAADDGDEQQAPPPPAKAAAPASTAAKAVAGGKAEAPAKAAKAAAKGDKTAKSGKAAKAEPPAAKAAQAPAKAGKAAKAGKRDTGGEK